MSHTISQSQPTISAYFQSSPPRKTRKRPGSPIDLTSDNEDIISNAKRPRTSENAESSTTDDAIHDDWRFSPEKTKQSGSSKPRTAAQNARHEAFKRKLLQDNSWLLSNSSNNLESRDDAMNVDSEKDANNPDEQDSGDESDRFQKLQELFSNKRKGKDKASEKCALPAKRSKKVVEVGPSGQPYTALEKQASYN